MGSEKIVLTHPVMGDSPMDTDHALSLMGREIAGDSNGGWKYKDKALQEEHIVEVAKAADLRNTPPVQPQPKTDAVNLRSDKGIPQEPKESSNDTKGGTPSGEA